MWLDVAALWATTRRARWLAALKGLRTDLIDPKIVEHAGRIFKSTGDGLLAEFSSVVNAVSCAVEIQRAVQRRNEDLPEEKVIQLRSVLALWGTQHNRHASLSRYQFAS
jgi:class 3 adenylate cyclase